MVAEKPQVKLDGRYPVCVAAPILGIKQRTLRAWVSRGVFRPGEIDITAYGRRTMVISGKALLRVWGASGLKERKFR